MISKPDTESNTAKTSWRDVLPIHDACNRMPAMTDAEFRALTVSIGKIGLQHKVTLLEDADGEVSLLDGRSRLDAAQEAGLKIVTDAGKLDPQYFEVVGLVELGLDPLTWVYVTNAERRHFTPEQKRELLAMLIELDPTKTDRQIARETKTSPTTVGKVRSMSSVDIKTERIEASGRKARGVKPMGAGALAPAAYDIREQTRATHQTRTEMLTAENDALRKRVQELECRLSQNGELCDFALSTADEIALTMVQKMSRTKFQAINKRGLEYFKQKDVGQKPRKVFAKKPNALNATAITGGTEP